MEGRTKRVPCPICIRIRLRSLCNRGELTPEVPLNGLGSLHDIRAKRGFGFMDFVVSHSNGERHTWWGWEFKGVAPCLITYIQFLYTKTCASLIVYHTVNGWYRKPTLTLLISFPAGADVAVTFQAFLHQNVGIRIWRVLLNRFKHLHSYCL